VLVQRVVMPGSGLESWTVLGDDHVPVLGRPLCSVPGCDRSGWEYGLCGGHSNRWRQQGRPELVGFLADAGTALKGRRGLSHCTVAGCRFGSSGSGLCMRHRGTWTRSGEPDPARWAAAVPAVSSRGRTECALPFCRVWVGSLSGGQVPLQTS